MEVTPPKQELDLDAISLSSGDYLDALNTADDSNEDVEETIIVNEGQDDFLEKENNLIMDTDEAEDVSSDLITEITEEDSASPSGNIVNKVPISGSEIGNPKKFIRLMNMKGSNALQRPLSMSNITSFRKPVTSIAMAVPRNVYSKVISSQGNSGSQQFIVTSTDSNKQQNFVKIVSSQPLTNTTKTITLAQAQKFGLLSQSKLQQILPAVSSGKNIVLNKTIMTSPKKVISMVKSPARILPSPSGIQPSALKTPQQRIVLKSNPVKPSTTQVIKIPTSSMSNIGLQQIQLPGSNKVQFVRIVQQPSATGSQPQIRPQYNSTITIAPSPGSSGANKNFPLFLSNVINVGQPQTVPKQIVKTINTLDNTSVPQMKMVVSNTGGSILVPASNISYFKIKPEKVVASTSSVKQSQMVQTVKLKSENSLSDQHSLSSFVTLENLELDDGEELAADATRTQQGARTLEPNGIRPRKPCNCTKSMCLKLYCDCFANGEFCYQCNCNCCFNNIEHEDDRHHAIRQCLERNPNAFRPKIGKCLVGEGERRHTKGCNCKRSGCLKNYCECYEAKIPCSNNCKCVSCRNVEENLFLRLCQSERPDKTAEAWKAKLAEDEDNSRLWSTKLAFSFMSESIVSATTHCLLAQAEKAQKNDADPEELQKLILEECGSCLQQIIGIASKTLSQKGHSSYNNS